MDKQAIDQDNPLIWPILDRLFHQPTGWKVHTVAQQLSDRRLWPALSGSDKELLFKKNFLLMNALYQLQDLVKDSHHLHISALNISLYELGHQSGQVDTHDPMRAYYLDWDNLEVSEQDITDLLDGFWSLYKQHVASNFVCDEREKALHIFKLPMEATDQQIKSQWKRLALQWHPDRHRGDKRKFQQLCAAWEVLRG